MPTDRSQELAKIFSSNVNYYIRRKNINRADVARDLEVPYTTFVDWTKGIKFPRMDKMEKLADYFGVTIDDLLTPKDSKTSSQDEVWEMRAELRQRPELKVLFDMSKKATKEDVEKAIQMMEIFIGKK